VKIVLAGDWHSNVHERPMAEALQRLGHLVQPFAWHTYFRPRGGAGIAAELPARVFRKAQNKYLVGPIIGQINADLIRLTEQLQPDLLFVYRGTHVTAATLREIRVRSPRTLLVGYNNDDPFAPAQPAWPWRHFLAAIPEYDRVLAYRRPNAGDFQRAGARSTGILLPWFVPAIHRPMELSAEDRLRYGAEVAFIGHFEKDDRLPYLEAVAAAGVDLRLFGPGRGYRGHDWDGPLRSSAALRHLAPVHEVWGDEYCKALCGARIALCFFSKRNRDAYTRRCFEIPATGTLMLSEYSSELASIYREGVEADFFRSKAELVEKVRFYLRDQPARDAVARAGYQRAYADGHDVESRMRAMLEQLAECAPRAKAG
jgi:spore maturation protein CgeB